MRWEMRWVLTMMMMIGLITFTTRNENTARPLGGGGGGGGGVLRRGDHSAELNTLLKRGRRDDQTSSSSSSFFIFIFSVYRNCCRFRLLLVLIALLDVHRNGSPRVVGGGKAERGQSAGRKDALPPQDDVLLGVDRTGGRLCRLLLLLLPLRRRGGGGH